MDETKMKNVQPDDKSVGVGRWKWLFPPHFPPYNRVARFPFKARVFAVYFLPCLPFLLLACKRKRKSMYLFV
jgi:hypothetical protein